MTREDQEPLAPRPSVVDGSGKVGGTPGKLAPQKGFHYRAPSQRQEGYPEARPLCTLVGSNPGEVSEWLKEHAWKACIRQRIEGSNPSLSATSLFTHVFHPESHPNALRDRGWRG